MVKLKKTEWREILIYTIENNVIRELEVVKVQGKVKTSEFQKKYNTKKIYCDELSKKVNTYIMSDETFIKNAENVETETINEL